MALTIDGFTFRLVDGGTLDTVITVYDGETDQLRTYRYSDEIARDYRDEDGTLNFEAFVEDIVLTDVECDDWEQERDEGKIWSPEGPNPAEW